MRRAIRVALLSAVVAALVGTAPVRAASGARGAETLLPYDTVLYVHLADARPVYEAAAESGFNNAFYAALQREGVPAAGVQAWDQVARSVRELHLAFRGLTVYDDGVEVGLVAVAEVDGALPAAIRDGLVEVPAADGAAVYRMGPLRLGELHLPLYVAETGGRLILGTDVGLVRAAAAPGRRREGLSLADNAACNRAMEALPRADVRAYAAGRGLLSMLLGMMDGWEREEFAAFTSLFGLQEVLAAGFASDYRGNSVLRLVANAHSDAYRLLAQPLTERQIVRFLPPTTLMSLSAGVDDGRATLRLFHEYLSGFLVRIGEIDGPAEYHGDLLDLQEELNVDLEELAAALEEFGFFVDGEWDEDGWCFHGTAREPAMAEEIMARMTSGEGFLREFGPEPRIYTRHGVGIHDYGGQWDHFVWAMADGTVLISPNPAVIERAVAAGAGPVSSVGEGEGYRALTAHVADRNTALAYFNVGAMLAAAGEDVSELPPLLAEPLRRLTIGVTLTAEDGMVELRAAQNTEFSVLHLFTAGAEFMRHAGRRGAPAPPAGRVRPIGPDEAPPARVPPG